MILILSLTVLPSILIALFVVFSDKFREPIIPLLCSFFLGFLIFFPASFLNYFTIFLRENPDSLVFIAGFTEEPLKFLALITFLRLTSAFDEPMDAIVYATLLSLGFATLENFDYVFSEDDEISSIFIALIRALSTIPMHACCGVVMGYYYGLYIFEGSNNLLVKSFCLPILIHAFYNYICTFNALTLVLLVPTIIFYATYLIDKTQDLQKQKNKER